MWRTARRQARRTACAARCAAASRRSTSSRPRTACGLQLTRFEGGAKGPVILTPGFGTSSIAYTIDTTDTNYPEYLYEHGYDVWVLDYRASPLLPSSVDAQFTLDDIARYDYPAAVDEGARGHRRRVGADHGALRRLAHDADGARSRPRRRPVGGRVAAHAASAGAARSTSSAPASTPADLLDALGVDTLTTEFDDDPSWVERLYDQALAIYPAGEEPCDRPFCRRVMFMYGEVYDHDKLNDATHDHIEEAFGVANMTHAHATSRRSSARTTPSAWTATTTTSTTSRGCGCRSPSSTASTTGSSSPKAAS